MRVITGNGSYDTIKLSELANENVAKVEESLRIDCKSTDRYPIGYIIPLGTLGNASNQETQFKSNFHIIAYTIADELSSETKDFEDFNIGESLADRGAITKMVLKLNDLAEEVFGKGWRITLFNVPIYTAIESMCRGSVDVINTHKAVEDFFGIVSNRVALLNSSSDKNRWKHEIIELFYTPLEAMSLSMTKVIDKEKDKQNSSSPIGADYIHSCCGLIIEALVYDTYANGLRLLTNKESFASTKIRMHSKYVIDKYKNTGDDMIDDELDNESDHGGGLITSTNNTEPNKDDNITYLFVLKARVNNELNAFRPIRQFSGKSKISSMGKISGCTERIIYNLVNKNYKHWSMMSLPSNLSLEFLNTNINKGV